MLRNIVRFSALAFSLLAIGSPLVGCKTSGSGDAALLAPGSPTPALQGTDHRGESVSLANLNGRAMLVFFYPRDATPGCTKEACALRDAWEEYSRAGIEVVGVSSDSNESHASFAKEESLPFGLIADTEGTWAAAFHVDANLGMYQRVSFLLGPDGKVAKVYDNVDPALHANEVLADARALGLASSANE